ncbi:MAG: stage V sporulation T C-terminal domain-containing protein [Clostridia bacterium]
MKATGIVRRIDDLGRIVIPKEIRRTLKIQEGSPLEIYTDNDGNVIFKKYSPVGEMLNLAEIYAQTAWESFGLSCAVVDTEKVIAVCGNAKKDIKNQNISSRMRNFLGQRKVKNTSEAIQLCENSEKYCSVTSVINSQGDPIGAIAFYDCADKITQSHQMAIKTMATLLGYQA